MKRCVSMGLAAILLLVLSAMFPALADYGATATTPLGDSPNRISNICLAAAAIDGANLPYGASFSFNALVGERSERRGYKTAVNGRGVKVVGGGVAQVASTLYLALKQVGGIQFDELDNYGSLYNQSYVSDAQDAILVDYNNGTDFAFTNYAGDMTISFSISGENLTCSLRFSEAAGENVETLLSRSVLSFSGNAALKNNVALAAGSIYDTTLFSGDAFSFNGLVGPRTEEYGYEMAVNGRGVEVLGGGVGQVASAVWLAVKDLPEISIAEKSIYGKRYNQSYVSDAQDAILVDYTVGTDFSFRYTGEGSITIYTRLTDGALICEIYRSSGFGDGAWWAQDADGSPDSWWAEGEEEEFTEWW